MLPNDPFEYPLPRPLHGATKPKVLYSGGMRTLPIAAAVIILSLGVATWSQPYELDWSHRSTPAQESPQEASSEPQAPPATVFTPKVRVVAPEERANRAEKADPITVQIVAEQSYDHYESRYRKVARVESLVYRGGYPQDLIHCNRARYDWFDVYLEDLEVGDRYKVRVTWDDGSHRTVERTIGPMSETSVYIREPLAYDSSFES
jgi:hypothetical protein